MKNNGAIPRSLSSAVGAVLLGLALPAGAVDWAGVKGKDMSLVFPGQSSWEWILTPSDHDGAKKFREGKACRECHEGEENKVGEATVSGKTPKGQAIAGMAPVIMLNVKAAHDAERLYVRMEWAEGASPAGPKQDPNVEAKATIFWDDGHVVAMDRGGCWGACHDDQVGMPSAKSGVDLPMYLPDSRTKITRAGGDENYKSADDLAKLVEEGKFLEYWHAHLDRGKPAMVEDGDVLEKLRKSDKPLAAAEGGFANGKWSVVFSRALKGGAPGRKDFVPGTVYSVGFAVHDAWTTGRYHHVSFRYTLALDAGKADIIAAKQ